MRTFIIVVVLVWLAIAGLTVLVQSGAPIAPPAGGVDVPTPVAEGVLTLLSMGGGIVIFAAAGLSIYLRP